MIDDHLRLWKYKKNALTMAHVISCDPCRFVQSGGIARNPAEEKIMTILAK